LAADAKLATLRVRTTWMWYADLSTGVFRRRSLFSLLALSFMGPIFVVLRAIFSAAFRRFFPAHMLVSLSPLLSIFSPRQFGICSGDNVGRSMG